MVSDCSIQRIAIIGAGNIATHLAIALHEAGYVISQIYSRTEVSARTLAERIGCPWTTRPENIDGDSELYIFAVSDAALEGLTEHTSANREALWVHTAGSMPMSVFEGKCRRYGVLYPLQTFSKNRPVNFSEIPVFIEADTPDDTARLRNVAESISRKILEASSEQRKQLHLAAVFACNFVNHLYAVADGLLAEQGLPFDALRPLIRETAAKIETLSPIDAQTGPAVRYDENVMQKHIALLRDPETQKIYRLLSDDIHHFAGKNKETKI